MWAAGGGVGVVLGSAAVSVLREVFTRCNGDMLGTSGCTGDSVLNGDSLAFVDCWFQKHGTFETFDVFFWKTAKNL